MVWEAAVWSLLGVGSPLLAARLRAPLEDRLDLAAWTLPEIAPWLHGLMLPFAAVLTGAVPATFLGLYGASSLVGWLGDTVLVLLLLLALRAFLQRRPLRSPDFRYDRIVLAEPRWALYRGSGQLWLADPALGALAGLLLAVAEWGLRTEIWRPERRVDPSVCLILARIATSSLVFVLTGNLWLTIAFQLAALALLERLPRAAET